MKNIVLMGYRCTGKSSVGRKLAEKLNLPFVDTDDFIEAEAGVSIDEMVKGHGWQEFRRREKDVIEELADRREIIIATGGGAFEDPVNRELLKNNGIFIWLTADAETIVSRLLSDPRSKEQRPSLSHTDLETETVTMLKKRDPVYRKLADLTIDTAKRGCDDIVDEICYCLKTIAARSNTT